MTGAGASGVEGGSAFWVGASAGCETDGSATGGGTDFAICRGTSATALRRFGRLAGATAGGESGSGDADNGTRAVSAEGDATSVAGATGCV